LAEKIKSDTLLRRRVIIMNEDKGRPGVRVDNLVKLDLKLALEKKIFKRKIKRYKNFFTLTTTPVAKLTPQDVWDEIIHQLQNYSKILKPSNDIHAPPREFFGGKMGYGYDDTAIAVQLNLICKRKFYSIGNDKYRKFISEKPKSNL
jgi:hypothetical protein